jgi:hypothetical protein
MKAVPHARVRIDPLLDAAASTALRAATYSRYSDDQQRETSITDQQRNCRRRAEAEGWVIAYQFADYAISGADSSRPEYQAMLKSARAGEFQRLSEKSSPGQAVRQSENCLSPFCLHASQYFKAAADPHRQYQHVLETCSGLCPQECRHKRSGRDFVDSCGLIGFPNEVGVALGFNQLRRRP